MSDITWKEIGCVPMACHLLCNSIPRPMLHKSVYEVLLDCIWWQVLGGTTETPMIFVSLLHVGRRCLSTCLITGSSLTNLMPSGCRAEIISVAKDLGHFWLGYIRMLGHLQLSAHLPNFERLQYRFHWVDLLYLKSQAY